jgi:branched-chain amino acid transport system ATP-binding protein
VARALATEPKLLPPRRADRGMNPQETARSPTSSRSSLEHDLTVLMIEHDMKVVMGISTA